MTIQQILHQISRNVRAIRQDFKSNYPQFYRFTQTKERTVVLIFLLLLGILFLRVFYIQLIQGSYYQQLLNQNHSLSQTTQAKRGNIYVSDASQIQPLKLTENVTLYNMFIDPSMVFDKPRLISIITPLLYLHLCQTNGFDNVDKEACIKNVENFTKETILPIAPTVFYYGDGIITGGSSVTGGSTTGMSVSLDSFDWTGYNAQYQEILSGMAKEQLEEKISQRLDSMIVVGDRKYNYLGYYSDIALINELRNLNRDYIYIYNNNYVFIEPKVWKNSAVSLATARKEIEAVLVKRGYLNDSLKVKNLFTVRNYRYVRLVTGVNPSIVDALNQLKTIYYSEKVGPNKIPLLHGIGTESYNKRYYPYGKFMSHILGYMSNNGDATYGVEEYFDDLLKGIDGSIEGTASSMIGQLGANDVKIKNAENGYDVYLTIDPVIQTQAEKIIGQYRDRFRADSVSMLVYDPFSGHVLASANAPDFDPNHYNDIYTLKALQPSQAQLVDNPTFLDFPIYIQTGGETRLATRVERQDTTIAKYVANNPLGPNLFVDKNIAYPYEPGSIFKAFTFAIGLDQNEIDLYDRYADPESQVKVGPYTIKNASVEACRGTHTFLHALQHSCNVGMVRIAQKLTQNTFYNYLEKLNFGSLTNIELAGEDPGYVEGVGSVSVARFFNNVFGQGLLVTPIQIAAGYGAMLNGGTYLKPTILDKLCESGTDNCQINQTKVIRQVFEPRISEQLAYSLTKVIEIPENGKYADLPQYNVGGKSGTSQISYRGRYMAGNGWTNGSFVGIVTEDNPKYIVVIQVRRPRSTQWGNQTAGVIFKDMASFLINYATLRGEKFEVN
ncbi:Stage V sporulation protein D [candidate division SR1 bacterium Aalborg_AAW-1]|nr:Stage V sporulation protein D [candidate division SR1 bacterium Aalborg_AAW-1]